jgi:ferredoxin-NADP reductase
VWQFETELSQVIPRTPSVKSFRFPIRAKGVRYQPGQFFFVTIKINGQEASHHFSFSSSPTEKGYIEFTKRITSHEFSRALDSIQPGAWARLQGAMGTFTLPRKQRRLAFISGGIGITPLRSMLRYIADRKLAHDVVLLYGNASFEEIAFRKELDALTAAHPNLRVEHVLSGPELPRNWKGKSGFINRELVVELIADYSQRLFYVSGPPRMVLSLKEQLVSLGLAEKQIKQDSFTGYD